MRKNIAIVAGGYSGEYVVSLNSAKVISKNINNAIYNTYTIFISKEKWVYITDDSVEFPVDKNDFSISISGEKIKFDCVFIAIHGTPGEDGLLQSYFDMLDVPYTSSGQIVSALTFNKNFCNKVVAQLGIQTAKSCHLFKHTTVRCDQILKELTLPCFVKPNKGGSSIGMSKVKKAEEMQAAIDLAFNEDDEVLIEEFVEGTEVTCGVFNYKGNVIIFPLTEIVPEAEFFDFEAKYNGKTQEITPARISEELEIKCKSTSSYLYRKLNCSGIVRFDYIISKKGLYFLEVNTVPGMTDASLVPQQAARHGIAIGELFTMLIEDAFYRYGK